MPLSADSTAATSVTTGQSVVDTLSCSSSGNPSSAECHTLSLDTLVTLMVSMLSLLPETLCVSLSEFAVLLEVTTAFEVSAALLCSVLAMEGIPVVSIDVACAITATATVSVSDLLQEGVNATTALGILARVNMVLTKPRYDLIARL